MLKYNYPFEKGFNNTLLVEVPIREDSRRQGSNGECMRLGDPI